MRHFLQYWRTYDPVQELGEPLNFAASAQFKKLKTGDTLWIVAVNDHRLLLLGRLVVGDVLTRREAVKQLGDRVYDAPLVAFAKPGTEQYIIEADIQDLAYNLRFESTHDRLVSDHNIGQQLQSLRELTAESAQSLQSTLNSAQNSQKQFPRRVLFARVGWMTYYAGPQTGDEKPVGGGENNKRNIGHEIFNFFDFEGKLYGFVRAAERRIRLERIDPSSEGETLGDVLVVFVAKQHIIGWYRKAIVQRLEVKLPPDASKEIKKRLKLANTKNFSVQRYCFECPVDDAVLLPRHERTFEIPGAVKGGFGQSNVCYTHLNNGKRKTSAWMKEAVAYVQNYSKGNLLRNPYADNESDDAATTSQEQAAGFQSSPAIRRAIEEFAMSRANSILLTKGYKNLKDTSKIKPYDYTCERDGKDFFVEVKGTQTLGKTLILTRGEVDHVRNHPEQCILVLVHSVQVSSNGTPRVSRGEVEVRESWSLLPEELSAIQYTWRIG